MKFRQLKKMVHVMATASVLITSGCAATFVRSQNTIEPQHIFPATTLDAWFFWDAGVKGAPLFATFDPHQKNGPVTRLAYGVGAIIDSPFSIVFDTLLVPVDVFRSKTVTDAPRQP